MFAAHLQPLVLSEVIRIARAEIDHAENQDPKRHEKLIQTGDGFIVVFHVDSNLKGPDVLEPARNIANKLDKRNNPRHNCPIHFRISITMGETFMTRDITGDENYAGDAIVEADRLISCMPDDIDDLVYFSDTVYREFKASFEEGGYRFTRLGTKRDKHGKSHRIYSLEYVD